MVSSLICISIIYNREIIIKRYYEDETVVGFILILFNPNRSLDHNVSGILVFVLFPYIFYFLIGILSVFLT